MTRHGSIAFLVNANVSAWAAAVFAAYGRPFSIGFAVFNGLLAVTVIAVEMVERHG